jgi:hypothetical protein
MGRSWLETRRRLPQVNGAACDAGCAIQFRRWFVGFNSQLVRVVVHEPHEATQLHGLPPSE